MLKTLTKNISPLRLEDASERGMRESDTTEVCVGIFPSFSRLLGALQSSSSWQHESDPTPVSIAFCHSCLLVC